MKVISQKVNLQSPEKRPWSFYMWTSKSFIVLQVIGDTFQHLYQRQLVLFWFLISWNISTVMKDLKDGGECCGIGWSSHLNSNLTLHQYWDTRFCWTCWVNGYFYLPSLHILLLKSLASTAAWSETDLVLYRLGLTKTIYPLLVCYSPSTLPT